LLWSSVPVANAELPPTTNNPATTTPPVATIIHFFARLTTPFGIVRPAPCANCREALLTWLARLRAKGFWLKEDDVFGNDDHVCALSIMGTRRAASKCKHAS
jgi:hypothetical protein